MYKKFNFLRNVCGCAGELTLILVVLAAALSACGPEAAAIPVDPTRFFPTVSGWTISEALQKYDHDHLFNLVDGQADSFFIYGFQWVATQRYQNDAGVRLNTEIWRLATPDDAYGLFSEGRAGEPASIGNEGDSDPGLRLAFWQDHYFVSLSVDQAVDEATLLAFGKAIAAALPSGGERPSILARLPSDGLVDRSPIFFHEEMSIQMEVWLGGENILGLDQDTNGVIARYSLADQTARLLLVEYPTSARAKAGLQALQGGEVSGLVVADVRGKVLAAVFGKVEKAQAESLLTESLK